RFKAPTDFGDTNIEVLSTAAGVNTVIDTGRVRRVDVGSFDSADNIQGLNDIQGELTIKRATPDGGVVVLNDAEQTTPQHYAFRANPDEPTSSVERDGMAKVTFEDTINQVQVKAGSANDGFFVFALRGGNGTYLLDGGHGDDELVGPGTNNFWDVTGTN